MKDLTLESFPCSRFIQYRRVTQARLPRCQVDYKGTVSVCLRSLTENAGIRTFLYTLSRRPVTILLRLNFILRTKSDNLCSLL